LSGVLSGFPVVRTKENPKGHRLPWRGLQNGMDVKPQQALSKLSLGGSSTKGSRSRHRIVHFAFGQDPVDRAASAGHAGALPFQGARAPIHKIFLSRASADAVRFKL